MRTDVDAPDSEDARTATVAARVQRVSLTYAEGVRALTDIDLALTRGTLTALIGANGSGKSTLLRMLAAVQEPTTGVVELLGMPRPSLSRWSSDRALRSRVTYISQSVALDPEMTGQETFTFLATCQGVPRSERATRIAQLAHSFALTPILSRLVRSYSGGQCQRLHVAAGLLSEAELLLLDEPTTGLDDEGCTMLWAELASYVTRGRTVALVTHDLLRARHHADQVVLLYAGKLIACGSPAKLIETVGETVGSSVAPAGSDEPALAWVYRALTGQAVAERWDVQPQRLPGGGGGGGGGGRRWRRAE